MTAGSVKILVAPALNSIGLLCLSGLQCPGEVCCQSSSFLLRAREVSQHFRRPEQVFRTYNASITLDALLNKESTATTVDEKKAEYDRANKEVSSHL